MAIAPLIVQTPRVSLIGGKELPKASGAGVAPVDVVSPFRQLQADLQRKDEENRSLTSSIEGTRYWEQERAASEAAGIGPDGLYKQLQPVPRGDRYFQTAYFNARAQNAASDIRTAMSARFNEIQSNFEEPSAVRLQKMQAYADGMVESFDPLLREEVRKQAAADIDGRGTSMANTDTQLTWKATVDGIKTRFDDAANRALSASSSGGNAQPHLLDAHKAIDDQVRLKLITEDTAFKQKAQLTEFVDAVGTQSEIVKFILNSDVSLEQADEFALKYKAGGNFDLVVARTGDPSIPPKSQGRLKEEGETTALADIKVFNTQALKEKFSDPKVQQEMAVRFQEAVDFQRARMKGREGLEAYLAALRAVAPTDNRLPDSFKDEQEKYLTELKLSGQLDTPQGLAVAKKITIASKIVSASFRDWMIDAATGTDPQKALAVVETWNELGSLRRGAAETGTTIRNSLSGPERELLDQVAALANQTVMPGDPNSLQTFAEKMRELIRKPDAAEDAVRNYNAEASQSAGAVEFGTRVRNLWNDTYQNFNMPPEFMAEVKLTYQIRANANNGASSQANLDAAFEQVAQGWQKSDILYGGVQRTRDPIWKNPPGYGKATVAPWSPGAWDNPIVNPNDPAAKFNLPNWAVPDNAWAIDYGLNVLGKLDDDGGVVFSDPEGRDAANFNFIMSRGPQAFGRGAQQFTYKPVRGNLAHPQMTIVMTMNDMSEVTLMTKDARGRTVPILVDVGLVNAHLHSKAKAEEDNKAVWDTLKRERTNVLDQQYRKVSGDRSGLYDFGAGIVSPTASWSDEDIRRFLDKQPEPDRKGLETVLDVQNDWYQKQLSINNARVPTVPSGVDLAPELLMTPKAGGVDATKAVISTIGKALGDPLATQNFMLNIAAVESNFGQAEGTYRASGDRGIFQINDGSQGAYREIIRRSRIAGDPIQIAADRLKPLGIDIANSRPSDLDRPLVNAAFARLYIMADPRPVTDDLAAQGEIWKDHYNTYLGAGSVQGFLSKAGKETMAGYSGSDNLAGGAGTDAVAAGAAGPGRVVDMSGRENPANFRSMSANAQIMATRLSGVFGQPIRITPHGGKQPDARRSTSQHHSGTAIDIYVEDMPENERKRLIMTAIQLGYKGIGGYAAGDGKGTIHLDLRSRNGNGPEGLAVWWRQRPGVDGPYGAAPDWFQTAIDDGAQLLRGTRGA